LRQLFKENNKKENILYGALWAILFLAPIPGMFMHHHEGDLFPWNELKDIWLQCTFFLIAFLIHNFLLAPILVYRQKRVLYISGLLALLAVFVTVQCIHRPNMGEHRMHHPEDNHRPPAEMAGRPFHGDPQDAPFDGPPPKPKERPRIDHRPPFIFGDHDIIATIIFLLVIGSNLGVKYYYRHRKDRERLVALERQNLEQQLEYLKYQINPHFLMNTLNNIHALVDIEPEQAKETIVELSKIMRFVLYEGSKQKVPLRQELIFLDNYIHLMRMRVDDQVDITVDIPQLIPDRQIPPLMLITFVENAFKHGVSYQQHSFININIQVDADHLNFSCKNSKVPQGEDRHGGVGLQNVKRRLQLIYGSSYTLNINEGADTYSVNLILPL
jgi:hypothetical protein